ncbi:HTH-type transcriptional regulator NorG [compost metagenome]
MDFGLSVVTQHIAAQFLQSSYMDAHLDGLRMNLNFKRDLMIDALRKELPNLVEFTIPEGGLHLWCRIIPEVNESRLLEESIRRGVIYVPGSVYGSNANYVRFTFARAKSEEIEPGIQRFAAALHAVLT